MTNDDTAAAGSSTRPDLDAPFVQTFELPPTIDRQIISAMAHAHELNTVGLTPLAITVEGREEDLKVFADRLEQLTRLCR